MAYPTIQEQVAMAKEISNFLESNQNKRSRGGRMFTKRKQRADEWTMNSQGQRRDIQQMTRYDSLSSGMPVFSMQKKEFGYNQVRHHPDPIKSKINAAELEQIQHNQDSLCKHDSLPPNVAFDINQALATSQGKAGQFFERRKQRAEKYVVDENSRKAWQPHGNNLTVLIDQTDDTRGAVPRSYKSPWEAAMEGRLDSAFDSQEQNVTRGGYQQVTEPQIHQPLNVITNNHVEGDRQHLETKYKSFKPVTPPMYTPSTVPGAAIASPAIGSMLPKQKTRLEMMIEGSNAPVASFPTNYEPTSHMNRSLQSHGELLLHPLTLLSVVTHHNSDCSIVAIVAL